MDITTYELLKIEVIIYAVIFVLGLSHQSSQPFYDFR